jgi:hypothetical protein
MGAAPYCATVARGRCVPSPACGGGFGRGFARDGLGDDLSDAGTIGHYIHIAESKNPESRCAQKRISTLIAHKPCRLVVLTAVDFDDEPCRVTDEIGDVGTDRHLPAEGCAVQPMGAENAPDDALGLGRVLAQIACATALQCRDVPVRSACIM